jgi:WD40 repeat protein
MTVWPAPNGRTIACGREDGSVQRWNTDGEMVKKVWTGHSKAVRSLSWSPGGSHLASGSENGIILVRQAESGEVAVGPIKTGRVMSLAYSPSGRRIVSGGDNICIWDSNTGKLLLGPIKDLRDTVTSVVWSSDSSKLYSIRTCFRQRLRHHPPSFEARQYTVYGRTFTKTQCTSVRGRCCTAMGHRVV